LHLGNILRDYDTEVDGEVEFERERDPAGGVTLVGKLKIYLATYLFLLGITVTLHAESSKFADDHTQN
jgi:hypothetical protein